MMFTKVWHYYREYGLVALLKRIRMAVYHRQRMVVYTKPLGNSNWSGRPDGIAYRAVTAEDIPWLSQQWPTRTNYIGNDAMTVLHMRLQNGEIGVVGVYSKAPDRLAFMAWLTTRGYATLTLLGEPLPAGNAGVRNLWVCPELRRRGIARNGLLWAEAFAYRQGVRQLWAFILPGNVASQRLLMGLGYVNHGEVEFSKNMGRRHAVLHQEGCSHSVQLDVAEGYLP